VVTPSRSCKSASWARVDTRSLASRLDRGSSIRNAWGSRTIARPMATRWRCPPDSAAGLRLRNGSNDSILATSATRRCWSALETLCSCRLKARLSSTVMWGYRA
jgi:hypothetical protein